MDQNTTIGKSSKRVLVVGKLGYHEKNIIEPILSEIRKRNHSVVRLGGNFDFFIESNFPTIIDNYLKSVPKNLEEFDLVFFVDYWNMVFPLFNYLRSIGKNIPFCGLFHGSVRLPNDVGNLVKNCYSYEDFLFESYDKIIVPYCSTVSYIPSDLRKNIKVCPFPVKEQFSRIRPNLSSTNKVIFAHRFEEDKGKSEFLSFVNYCKEKKSGTKFIVTSDGKDTENLQFAGRLSQNELKELCSDGGYAWSSVKSETFGYAMLDLISYGLTPLTNYHEAYWIFSDIFKYKSNENALDIIKSGVTFNNEDWEEAKNYLDKLEHLVDIILGETE